MDVIAVPFERTARLRRSKDHRLLAGIADDEDFGIAGQERVLQIHPLQGPESAAERDLLFRCHLGLTGKHQYPI